MKEEKVYNIGVLIGNAHTSHPTELSQGICQGAREYNCNLLFFLGTQSSVFSQDIYGYKMGEDYDYQFNVIYDYALLGNLDALIISYGTLCIFYENQDRNDFFRKFQDIPCIVLEERGLENDGNYIISGNFDGMSAIMEHLVADHGYEKIVYVSGPKNNTDATERREAYLSVMNKYNLPVDDSMIEYGDYSEFVEEQVERLLDKHPDAEAVVCANDEMALATYKVCAKRGIVVGRDLAVTGYDDFSKAQTMEPPLTTAEQNGYDMGYSALVQAINLCKGSDKIQIRQPAKLIKRCSCGCINSKKAKKEKFKTKEEAYYYAESKIEELTEQCTLHQGNKKLTEHVRSNVKNLVLYIMNYFLFSGTERNLEYDKKGAIDILNNIISGPYQDFVSSLTLIHMMEEFLRDLADCAGDDVKKMNVLELNTSIQNNIYYRFCLSKDEEYTFYKRKSLMEPLFERSVLECINDEKEVYYQAALQLLKRNIPRAYIYIFDQPITHRKGAEWNLPARMYLASCCEEEKVIGFPQNERPVVNMQTGFCDYLPKEKGHTMLSFILFSEEKQYGLLMCESSYEEIPALYVTSLQIGNIMRFLEMSKKEKKIQKELAAKMKIIEEKNEVLNFISEYDQLTGILNRRGFGENALRLNKRNMNKKGYFIFADLDHLKEINDCFGHSEGDYAISKAALLLKDSLGAEGAAGRLGGDEFVAMIISDETGFVDNYKRHMKEEMEKLNASSGKPYYVECSLGVIEFVCSDSFELSHMLKEADNALYEAKRERRASIKK
ncbi:MAG: GGDEF domain-containing protein [Lachnospiraceae bacterium]|nr:GGDEF domain-containing protein [Lachnospiraceae bacterium]